MTEDTNVVKQTVIIFGDEDDGAVISTTSRKWINRMIKLEGEGHAKEVEASVEGTREFEFSKTMLKMPFYRKPREYTKEQLEASRKRLEKVREKVKSAKGESPPKESKPASPPAVEEKVPDPIPVHDDFEDDEDAEEVMVKRPKKPKRRRRP